MGFIKSQIPHVLLLLVTAETLAVNDTVTNVMKIKFEPKRNGENVNGTIRNLNFTNGIENEREASTEKRNFFPPDLYRVMLAINTLPDGLCRNDSQSIMEAVINHEKWALKMFDSSPKFPVGMLYGSYFQLGNFDECILIKEPLPPSERYIQGQYCLADIRLEPSSATDERIARSSGEFYYHEPKSRISFNDTLHWAVCVPSSCTPKDVEQFLRALFNIAISRKAITIEVPQFRCHYEKDIPYSILEIFYVSFITFVVVLVLLATVFHVIKIYRKPKNIDDTNSLQRTSEPKIYVKLILAFSLIRSIGKLLHVATPEVSLDCIFGIRFISMMLVIASHSLLFLVSGPVLNEDFFLEAVQKPRNALLTNNPLMVETFLLVSGFLMCRLLLLELDKRKGKVNILVLYIARYIRLTPSYLVVIFFYITVFKRMDSGPLWNERIGMEQDRCLKSWWANILYINNYINVDNICMFQSWYLAADTHLYIISPFIIYPLWKWPKLGEILLGILTFIAILIPCIITYVYNLDPTIMVVPSQISEITKNSYYMFAYIKTHMRAISYCVGLIGGYVVHRLQSSNIKMSNSVIWVGWIIALLCGVISMFSITIFYIPQHEHNTIESAAYSSLHKIGWSLSVAWVIIACATDNSGPIRRFLSWSLFVPLSRLTYCAYLVNGIIELHGLGTRRSPLYLSTYNMASITVAHWLLTFTAGAILCVLFESPIHSIEKIILTEESKWRKKRTEKRHENSIKL